MEFARIHVNSDDVNLNKRKESKQLLRSLNLRLFDMIASLSHNQTNATRKRAKLA